MQRNKELISLRSMIGGTITWRDMHAQPSKLKKSMKVKIKLTSSGVHLGQVG